MFNLDLQSYIPLGYNYIRGNIFFIPASVFMYRKETIWKEKDFAILI